MTLAPDTADLAPPKDPAIYARRRSAAPAIWGLVVFGVLCIAVGAGTAIYGPRLLAARPHPTQALVQQPAVTTPPVAPVLPATAPAPAPLVAPAADVDGLRARVAALEAGQARLSQAASAALAAATLSEISQGSAPFPDAVTAAGRLAPLSADAQALRALAQTGAPSRATLIQTFPDVADRAALALRDPGPGGGVVARALHALASVVMIRNVGDSAKGADAALVRAERAIVAGDLEGGLKALDALPAPARAAFADWRAGAERRVEIDRRVANLRATAAQTLVASGGGA